jgi:hypothetical protein
MECLVDFGGDENFQLPHETFDVEVVVVAAGKGMAESMVHF